VSSEERQRQLREQGSRPAEAQRQQQAQASREALEREEAQREGAQPGSPDEPSPVAEDDASRPRPRR
jgi:hypothetical protein